MSIIETTSGTLFLIVMISILNVMYRHKGKPYVESKEPQQTVIIGFKSIDPYLRISTVAFGLMSLYSDSNYLLKIYENVILFYIGISIAMLGLVIFISAKLTLGKNYSPCYDAYLPHDVVQRGIYQFIRHPIYTANLTIIAGLFIMTGSLLLLFNWLILFYFYNSSAIAEEKELREKFPEYSQYILHTNRYLPRI